MFAHGERRVVGRRAVVGGRALGRGGGGAGRRQSCELVAERPTATPSHALGRSSVRLLRSSCLVTWRPRHYRHRVGYTIAQKNTSVPHIRFLQPQIVQHLATAEIEYTSPPGGNNIRHERGTTKIQQRQMLTPSIAL